MKQLLQLMILINIIIVTSTCCSEVVIRPAVENDINKLNAISHVAYQNDFKSLWQNNYAHLTPAHQTIEEFVIEKENNNNTTNVRYIQQQKSNNNYRLLVATIKNKDLTENIAGFCRLEKTSDTHMYIHYILINEQFRRQGIGKKLIASALKTWDTVHTCNFRALINHTFVNNLYKQHGCIQTNTVSLDPNNGKVITDPNAAKTHYEYLYFLTNTDNNFITQLDLVK